MQATGNRPPGTVENKRRWMADDMARWLAHYGIPFSRNSALSVQQPGRLARRRGVHGRPGHQALLRRHVSRGLGRGPRPRRPGGDRQGLRRSRASSPTSSASGSPTRRSRTSSRPTPTTRSPAACSARRPSSSTAACISARTGCGWSPRTSASRSPRRSRSCSPAASTPRSMAKRERPHELSRRALRRFRQDRAGDRGRDRHRSHDGRGAGAGRRARADRLAQGRGLRGGRGRAERAGRGGFRRGLRRRRLDGRRAAPRWQRPSGRAPTGCTSSSTMPARAGAPLTRTSPSTPGTR